jgi:phosphomannomutase
MDQLLFSISGARGVIGRGLDPIVFTRLAAHFGAWCGNGLVVVGRDSRVSGEMAMAAVTSGLLGVGCDVVDLGIVPTPTVEVAVRQLRASGGIQISASHNPAEWNALKLLSSRGIFLTASEGAELKARIDSGPPKFHPWDLLGRRTQRTDLVALHIETILASPLVDVNAIRARGLVAAVDCVAGAGGAAARLLLEKLGVLAHFLHEEPTGRFPRNPEPLPENLVELCGAVHAHGADIGFALDPDADRVAVVDEKGRAIGEEVTLAVVVDSFLDELGPEVVVNVSTTMAIDDVAARHGGRVHRTAVGEVNVTEKMLEIGARIGGEGNGGIIVPEINPGRDGLLGMALWLSGLARTGETVSERVSHIPATVMRKGKIDTKEVDLDAALAELRKEFGTARFDEVDGLKLVFEDGWVHLRRSNTEPILRLIVEARTSTRADELVRRTREIVLGARTA